ncbi:hypothetical protein L3Q82_023193 [Scortum barcoo]|uniref:Uncharacterized protein n=1 Tax=Scortum barcoo TaxID=214431 RepID=A0ACB8WYZ5_9TELE|nr:hypothetical protein L3Q82_023193 [Scortum barcoo]
MDKMMSEVESWQRDPESFLRRQVLNPERTTAAPDEDVFVLIVEGFLIFNYRPLNDLFDKRYFLEIPNDICKRRRSSRIYTPPDPPGFFDEYVWPMYLKNRQEMENMVSGIVFLDGLKPKEELLADVCEDVCQGIERLRMWSHHKSSIYPPIPNKPHLVSVNLIAIMFPAHHSPYYMQGPTKRHFVASDVLCDSKGLPTKLNQEAVNDRPVIGILTQLVSDDVMKPFGSTYIPASYVKYIESGGSRVMPIRLTLTTKEYENIFRQINGLLFIGGAADLETSDFARVAKIFYRLALRANDAGDFFPIWGTCMGMQLLTVLVAGENLLTNTTAENVALPLNLTTEAGSSRMFEGFPNELMKALTQEPLTGNFHHYGVTVQTFQENAKLQGFFSLLSTNVAENGAHFVSTLEGKRYPFCPTEYSGGTQRTRCFCLPHLSLSWQADGGSPCALRPRFLRPPGLRLVGKHDSDPAGEDSPCGALMHPFQWCNGCFCGLGLVYSNKSCTMPPITFQDLPLNIYMVIFGTGIFVFILSLIFCCYFISKLRHQAQSERFGYREVILKGDPKKLSLHGQTCAVCLEDFKVKDELGVLPCQHAFHRKCLVKWLEVRCVCPMCNKPIAGPPEQHHSIGTLLDELV